MAASGEHHISDPTGIADAFYKHYPDAVSGIENIRLMKGREIPDWPYWCFLLESCWLILFMGKRRKPFTREMYQEIQKLQVLGTWRYSKGIYSVHPALLNALTETPVSDSLPVDVFLRLPEWCIYIRTPGMIMAGERLHGFWATINQGVADNEKRLCLLLNRQGGIQTESFPLKSGSVKSIQEKMFSDGLDVSGAGADVIEPLKQSGYITDYLRRKSDDIGKLLSLLLFICSDEPEIDSEREPGMYPVRPKQVKTKKGFRLFPAAGPRYWTVGSNTGEMLVTLFDSAGASSINGRQVRTHLRRGHWHGFWSGKRDGSEDRIFSYRWLPPQVIGGRQRKSAVSDY